MARTQLIPATTALLVGAVIALAGCTGDDDPKPAESTAASSATASEGAPYLVGAGRHGPFGRGRG